MRMMIIAVFAAALLVGCGGSSGGGGAAGEAPKKFALSRGNVQSATAENIEESLYGV